MAGSQFGQIEAMYQAHGAAVLRYLQRNFGSCAAPEDLLQETFLRLLARGDRLAQAVSPQAFLFGIARHVGLSAARRAKVTRTTAIGDLTAPESISNETELSEMRNAIAKLPEQMRETLALRLQDRLSYDEIAEVLRIPVGTVRSRLHTAMCTLR